ncbi:MAG: EAL domain-containing protein [Thermoanaerobaculia bacterium]
MPNPKGQAALDRALDEENLVLVYQPIHDARTRGIVAAEALVRQRRESGEVREAAIITKAAEHGPDLFLFDSVTTRMALRDAATWQNQFDIRLNVNLSAREFQEGNKLARVTDLMTQCQIDPHRINLEITEASLIKNAEKMAGVLRELKKLGLEIWLDDFGTGHWTVEHLKLFPANGLKIPETFVKGVPHEPRSRAITHALIALAHDLEMRVIAEGVEQNAQLEFLLDEGCDLIQGFLLSRPVTVDRLHAVISSFPSSGQ